MPQRRPTALSAGATPWVAVPPAGVPPAGKLPVMPRPEAPRPPVVPVPGGGRLTSVAWPVPGPPGALGLRSAARSHAASARAASSARVLARTVMRQRVVVVVLGVEPEAPIDPVLPPELLLPLGLLPMEALPPEVEPEPEEPAVLLGLVEELPEPPELPAVLLPEEPLPVPAAPVPSGPRLQAARESDAAAIRARAALREKVVAFIRKLLGWCRGKRQAAAPAAYVAL